MGRERVSSLAPTSEGDDFRAARLFRCASVRLAVPASTDAAFVRCCGAALEQGWREARQAGDWSGRAAAMVDALADVYGEPFAARVRVRVAAEPLTGDSARRDQYVLACMRQFRNQT